MREGDSIRRSTLWVMVGGFGLQALNFLVGIVLARLLVPADFGTIVTIQIFTGLASFMASGGMGVALVQAKEVEARDFDIVFTAQLLTATLIYTFFFLVAPYFSVWYGNPLYGDLLRVSAISFLLRPFSNLPMSKLQRNMQFKRRVMVQASTQITAMATSISLAFAGAGVWSLTLSGLVGGTIGMFVASHLAHWRPRLMWDKSRIKKYIGFGFLISVNDLLDYMRSQTTNFVLSRTASTSSVGLYNKAESLFMTPTNLISGSLYQPIFRALAAKQDHQPTTSYLYFRAVTLLGAYMAPLYTAMLFAASPFLVTLYGHAWEPSGDALRILAIGGFFTCVGHPASAVLLALGKIRQEIAVGLIAWAVLLIGLTLGGRAGLEGVAWAVSCTYIVGSLGLYYSATRLLKLKNIAILRAIWPGAYLSMLVAAAMLITEYVFYKYIAGGPMLHLASLTIAWCLSFGLGFFVFTPRGLETEAARWRNKIFGKQLPEAH